MNAVRRRASVRTTTSRIRRFFTRRNSILSGVATLIVVFGLLFASAPTAQAYSTAVWSEVRSTTGGGGDGRADCPAGPSGEVIYGVESEGVNYGGANTLTYTTAWCSTLTATGTSIGAYQRTLGPYGSARSYGPASQTCYIAPYAYAVIGAIVYKTPSGFVSGVALKCGLLPTGAYYTTTGVLGWSSSTFENVDCPANQVAVGLFVGHGGILDKFGLRCGPVSGVSQASVTVTSTTGTFGSTVGLTSSGGSGAGAVSYAVTSAGTAGCSVSGTTLSATAVGTCTVTATKAADTNYNSAASSATTVTFSKANQTITFANPGTKERSTTPFAVAPTASSGQPVSIASSTTGVCTTSGLNITMVATGTCTIVASQSGNGNYNAATDVSNSFTIQDTTAPTLSSSSFTSSAGADNTYVAGDSIQATFNFTEAVNVTGTPTVTFLVGSTNRTASYVSGTGTTALVFSYTVVAGDNDTNGVTATASTLTAGVGTIRDAASNNATLTFAGISASLSHLVDTTAPTVSITRSGSGTVISGQTVTVTFTFSESVTGFDASDIQRCPSGASNGSFAPVSGSGTTYTAVFTPTADTASGNANLCLGPGAVSDAGGNAMSAWSSILNMAVDTRLPTVTAFTSSTSNGTYASGSTIAISATTSEAIQSGNTITATLDTGATVTLTAASAGTSLTGTYTVASGQSSSDLNVSSFTIGTVLDTAGNAMTSTTVPSGASNIAGAKAIVIEGILPTITAFSSLTADGTYAIGATVNISATTSEAIQSGNTLTVTLETGSTDRTVLLTAASAGTSLTGTYTVQSGDTTSDLTVASFTIGIVADTAGNAMTSTTVPSGASNIAGAKAIVIDGVVPTMTVVASPSSVSSAGTSTVTFTASEATSTFALADVSATLGSLSNFQTVSSTSYTATFTAAQSVGGTATISVSSGSFTDSVGNASAAAFTGSITVTNTSASSGGRVAALSGATNYIIERFTTAGASTWVAPRGITAIDLLVVGGGGGGGSRGAGGGGAGGYAETTNYAVTAGSTYNVTVGSGGAGVVSSITGSGSAGSASSFLLSSTGLTANGGGGGYQHGWNSASGGASGTATGTGAVASNAGGAGRESGLCGSTSDWCGGGGGGAGGVGTAAVSTGGNGGAGRASSITGSSVTYGGGGAGGGGDTSQPSNSPSAGGTGGSGGGGNGGTPTWNAATSTCSPGAGANGAVNTGSGGGGGGYCETGNGGGGNGGTGIVVVRYALPSTSTPDLDATDDLGSSSTDNITSATTLTFTGSAPVGSTVQLYVDGVVSGSTCTTSSTTGVWTCDTGVLTSGDKVVTAVSTTVLTDSTVTSTSSSLTVTVDTTAPTVSISASSTSLRSSQTSTLTFTLSEASTNFVVGDITVSGGALTSFTGSGNSYTVSFTPTANTQSGTGSVSVALGTFTDAASNNNTASSATTITYDTQVATVSSLSVTSSAGVDNTYVAGDSIRVTVNFSESVTVTGTPTISVLVGATTRSAAYISGSGTSALVFGYTVVSGDNDTDGVSVTLNSLALAGGTINDAAGNASTLTQSAVATSTSHKVDTTAPTVTIATTSTSLRASQTSTLTFTLSESTTDFVVGDITVTGGTLSSFTAVSGTSYTVVYTPTADTQSGSGSVSVASGAFTDAAGNTSAASLATSITYDTQAPSVVSIVAGASTLKSGQTSTLTITLSEASSNFIVTDITATGGTLTSFTGVSSTSYTVVFTPTANTQSGSGSVSVASGVFSDAAGNTNTASSTTTITYDTQAPTVTAFSSSTTDGSFGIGGTVNISATTSEAVQSGNTLTVTLETGTTDRTVLLTAASAGTSLTGTYTVQSGDTTSDLTVASFTIGTVADIAGNAMTSTTVPSGASNIAGAKAIVIDGVVPTMTVVASPSSVSSGGTSTVTFTSTKTTTNFALADISATLGTLSSFSGSGTTYTATFTASPSVGGNASVTVASGSFTDSLGNASAAAFTGDITVNNTSASSGGRVAALSGGTNYIIERFTTVGTSSWTVPRGVSSVEYLVVAGGGGGAGGHATAHGGGGGGAGGYRTATLSGLTAGTSYSVTVGAGGSGGAARNIGATGGNSVFGSVTSLGGGGGGSYFIAPTTGGSGGGAGASTDLITGASGTAGQGFAGGNTPTQDFTTNGAGGGGSGGVGSNGVNNGASAAGGIGTASSISGTSVTRAAGGAGGLGSTSAAGATGSQNSGNGGGGGSAVGGVEGLGGAGGSGIVVVRYALPSVSTPDLDVADDLGPSGTDDITSATTLTFTGSAPVGSTVQLYVDGVASGSTCTANATTGVWSCDTGVLTAGDKVITAESTTILTDSTVTSTSSGLSVTVETTAPTVSISASSSTLKSGQASTLTFTLSETSSNFVVGDITFSGGTLSSFTAVSGTSYMVVFTPTTSTQSGSGSVSVASGAFTDTAGNTNTAGSTTSLTYDTQLPTVSNVTSSSTNGTFTIGGTVSIQVVFSEAVTVSGTPRLTLETGSTDRAVDYVSGSGTTSLTFTYTVQTGDSSSDLDYVSTSSLALNGGSIVDAASNAATLTLPAPGASGSLGANKAIVVTSAPTKVVSARMPVGTASGAAFTTQPQVSLQDSGSNVVTSDSSTVVTASVSAGATLVGTQTATASSGVATFNNLGITGTAGTAYTITYSATFGGNALTVATQSVIPTVGAATQISITTQPVGATAGAALSTQPVVKVLDSGNNVVTTANVSITATASGGTLAGTTTVSTSSGVATFTDLTFAGTANTNYTLTFAASGYTSQTSSSFSVGVGAATKLVLTTSAATAKYGQAFTTQPVVQFQDAGSNVVTTSSAVVTASLSSGTVVGTGNATSSSGVATFSGLGITGSPGSYTVTYSSGSLATASQSITVIRADQNALSLTSTSGTYGAALTLTTSGGSGTGANTYVVVNRTATGCIESGGVLTVTSAGSCTVTATKALDTNYNAVSSSATTVSFAKANQSSLTLTSTSGTYGAALTLTTSGGTTAGSLSYSVTGTGCSITSGALSKSAAGDCSVTATMAGNGNYEPVSSSATTVSFAKANQSALTVTSTSGTYGSSLTLATSGGTTNGSITYVVNGTGCSITTGALSKSSAGDCSVTATMAGNGNYEPVSSAATTVSFGLASQSALTLTSTSGTYGSSLTLATSGGTTNGSITYVVTGTGCSITSGALSKSAAGDCAVTATMAGNSDYNAVSSSATTVSFARVALTVTADAKSKQYGASDPSLTHTITSGALVGSDALSGSLTRASGEDVGTYAINQGTLTNSNYDITYASANLTVTQRPITVTAAAVSKQYGAADPTFTHSVTTGSLVGQDALTGSLSRTSGENVGTYAIAQGALANANYDITFVPANMSITQRPITVTAAAKSKEYGASDPALTFSVTTGSLVGSDTLTGSLTRVSGESVGTYAILRGTVENTNYDITYVGALLSVSQRPITVTAAAKSKEYGASDPALTYSVTTGSLVGSDTLTGTLSRASGDSVGTYAINQGTLANSNYDITYAGANLTVTQRPITVTADAKSKQYGASDPALTHVISSGSLLSGDALSGSLSRASGEDVGTYAINQGTLANSNYDITYAGANLTVTQRPITVSADSATKQYGASDPTFTFAITTGSLVGQDALTGSLSRTSGSNVGSYALTIGTLTNANYDITFVPANLSITQRPITVTAAAKSKEYGALDPTLTYSVTAGSLVGQDAMSGSLTRVSGESVGTYAILRGTLDNSNYDITYAGALLSVSQRPITVTADAKSKEYGASDPTLTYSLSTGSLVGSDTLTGTLSRASGDSVGTYAINQGTLANSNYDITFAGANLTVTQRPITVTADAKSKEYGATDPALTYAVTAGSLVGQDALSGSLTRVSGESVGAYAIGQGSLANSNYDITYVPADVTVTQRPLSITADAATKEYGATDPTFTYVITSGSLVGQDTLLGSLSRTSGANVGSYALTIGTLANSNYNITFIPANLTISQRPVTVTAADKTKVFGSTDPSLTYSVTTGSLVGSDSFSGGLSRVSGENVGTYAINQGTLANSNYDISFVNGAMSVTRATQNALTVTTSQVTYGTSVVLGSSGGSGTGDVAFAVSSAGSAGCSIASDTLTATGDVGSTCTVTATKAQSTNYNAATSATKTITVIDRAITVTATAVSKTYGDSDPTFAYAITSGALVSGDTLAGALGRTSGENVGTYAISQGNLANSNYAITFVSADLTIDARPLTITATNRTKTFGDADPSLAYTITTGSLVGSDALSGSVSRNSGENIGNYVIGQGTLANSNYAITFNNGSFVINGANQSGFTLSAASTLVTYQDTTTLSTSGGNGNGTVAYEVTDGTGGCTISGNTVTAIATGTCVISATKAQEGNYNAATSNNVTITVARRAQIVTFTKPADRNFSTTAFTLAPSVDSGLTPALTSQTANVCTVSGLTVTMRDSGTCTLVASSNSTTNYAAATDVTQSFEIAAVVPYAPILDSLTASDGAISASFTLGNSGGSALLNHEYSLDNGVTWSPWPNGSITSPLNISNLTNGVEYQVKIRAVNAIGAGAESNMLAVTPLAPVIVVAAPVQTAESTTTVVSSSTTVFVVTTVKRNPAGRGTTTTIARRAVTTTVASRNGQIATTTTTVITTTTTGSTTTTSPATSTTSVERQPAIVERATSTTVKTQTSIFQSFTPTVPAANVPDTIPARLSPTDVASVVAGRSAQVEVTQIDKQQVHAAIGESTMMVASVGENGALEPLLANGSVALSRGSTLRVDGTGMLPGSQVAVWLHSTPTKLGLVDVEADGSYAEVLSVPVNIELGGHKVQFIGSAPDGSIMEFALGVTVVDETVLIMNKAGAMSASQADSLADANVVSVGTLSSADSAKLMLWFLVILLLVAGLIATKSQRIGVVASRVQRFEMATPWLNGFAVPRLLMVFVGILAGFGAANSTMFDASAPSALWIAIIVAIGVLDVVAGSVAGGIFICSVLANGSVQSISDIRLMAIVASLGFLPSSIARVVRPSAGNRSVSVTVSIVMHAVLVVALLNLFTPLTGMQFAATQSISEIAWIAGLAVIGRELLLKVTHTNEDQRATALPVLRLIGVLALSMLVFASPVTSVWTISAWAVLSAVVVVGLRIRVGLRAPSSQRVFISSIAAGFLFVAISTGAFIPNNQVDQITGATSVLPIGDLKVIGELDVLIDGYPRTFVAIKTGEGEVTFINGAVGQSLTIDSLTKDGDRIPLTESNQLQLVRGQSISISANGYAQNEAMNAWLFSDPVLLGNATTNDNGSLKSKFEVPNAPADGAHTLQIRLIDVDGKIVTFAIPIVLISEVPNGAA